MSQYLYMKDKSNDTVIFAVSRSNDLYEEIIDCTGIVYDTEVRIDNFDRLFVDLNERISRAEKRLMLTRSFPVYDVNEYLSDQEYLIELYEMRGQISLINYMVRDNENLVFIYH